MFVFHQFRYRFYRFYQLILFHSVIGSRLDYIPPLIVKPTALEFNDSTPSYSRLLENSRLIPSEWSFRAFKICLWGNATRSFLALRRIIVMKSSKESTFCRCIPNLSKVAGLDPVFNLNLVQHQPLYSFSLSSLTKMYVSRLLSFPNSPTAPTSDTLIMQMFLRDFVLHEFRVSYLHYRLPPLQI